MCHPNYIKTVTNNITQVLHLQQLGTGECARPFRRPQSQRTIRYWNGLLVFVVSGQLVLSLYLNQIS